MVLKVHIYVYSNQTAYPRKSRGSGGDVVINICSNPTPRAPLTNFGLPAGLPAPRQQGVFLLINVSMIGLLLKEKSEAAHIGDDPEQVCPPRLHPHPAWFSMK